MSLRCFMQEQAPIPGTAAQPVRYPACEWVGDAGEVDLHHPLNRFVCAWLTSDVDTVERCQEVLDAITQIESGQRKQWFADGNAFRVDFSAQAVQYHFAHVGLNDDAWCNLPQSRFELTEIQTLTQNWIDYLNILNT